MSLFPDDGIISFGKAHDEVMGLGNTGGFHHFLVSSAAVAPTDIVCDGAGEKLAFLQHHSDAGAQAGKG